MNAKKKNLIVLIIKYLILFVALIITLIPLVYAVASSFKTNAEIFAHPERIFPEHFSLDNYITAWNSNNFNIGRMLWNSTYYTVMSLVIILTLSSFTGYVFARADFPGKKVIFAVMSAMMFVSVGTITIYPKFEILNVFGLATSLWGLIAMKFFGCSVVNVYLVRSYIRTLPTALDEAAKIDGCGFLRTFFSIIFPLLKPIIATIGIMTFQGSWNDYLMPTLFTLSRPDQRTLISGIMALKTSGQAAASVNLMLAGVTVAVIPVLIVYAIGNKYFVSGLTAGAVKS